MDYDFDRLLDPAPLALEMGYRRLESGVIDIAVRTDLHGCTGAMLEWWFGSRPGDREYRWWHPLDHVSSSWDGGEAGAAVGSTHVVRERMTDLPAQDLLIQFRDPTEAFDERKLRAARASGAVSGLVYGHAAPQDLAQYTPDGALVGTRLIHLCRDTGWGAVLRSRFLFGFDLPELGLTPKQLGDMIPEGVGPNLLQHCYDEFTFLSRVLPAIHTAEHLDRGAIERPW